MIDVSKEFLDKFPDLNRHYLNRYLKLLSKNYIVEKSKYEKHHILPKSLFPEHKKEKGNLIKLPFKAHFLAHWILFRMLPNNDEMNIAFFLMCNHKNHTSKHSKDYDNSRKLYVKSASENTKINNEKRFNASIHNFQGENHPMKLASRNGTHHLQGERHPNHGLKPWNQSKKTDKSMVTWRNAELSYKFYLLNPSVGGRKHYGYLTKETNTAVSRMSVRNMLKMFRGGWIPREDLEWIGFYNVQNNQDTARLKKCESTP